jgi:putative membrane protein
MAEGSAPTRERWWPAYPVIAAKGFCMGAADVVPGVSGGTMALILGIYERLLGAIRAFDFGLLRILAARDLARAARHVDLWFLVALALGIALALAFFTRVVALPTLIVTDPVPVYSLFFGLVAASIVVLLREMPGLGVRDLPWLAVGTAAGLVIVTTVPASTPDAAWFVFLAGAAAICAMILPGISGSFILLLLKKYAYVFDAIASLDLSVLVPFALGAACGLALFSRFLVWLLGRFRRFTLDAIIGVLVASLWVIWPFQERVYEVVRGKERLVSSTPLPPWEASVGLGPAAAWMALGLALVLVVHLAAARRTQRDAACAGGAADSGAN